MQSTVPEAAAKLNEEQVAARHLVALLTREQAQLIEADIDGLTVTTNEKAKAVAQMTELAMARHRALGGSGYDANEAGMRAWVDATPEGAAAAKAWGELLALATAAKELNRTNGMLINTHMIRNQGAINALQVNAQGGSFYGPDGQATARAVGRGVVVG